MAGRCLELWEQLISRSWDYRVSVDELPCGARLIDAGVKAGGSREAGRIITEICHGGLCEASLGIVELGEHILPQITVDSFHPTISAYNIQSGFIIEGQIVSGPIRLLLGNAPAADTVLPCFHSGEAGISVIQSDDLPSNEWALSLAEESSIAPQELCLIVMPLQSIAGVTQIAGRINENVIFTLERSIGYDSSKVKHIIGSAPIAPVAAGQGSNRIPLPDDFLHYAGSVFITIAAEPGEDLQILAEKLCFSSTSIYGRFFHDLLQEAKGNFEDIPDLLNINKVARVAINELTSGRIYRAGKIDLEVISELLLTGSDHGE
jgi:methenyltetrahydromethanopterin cyclohydrolase